MHFTSAVSKKLTLTRLRASNRYRLRLLPGMPRQTRRIAVYAQFLCPPRLQLILREHPENRFAHNPLRPRLTDARSEERRVGKEWRSAWWAHREEVQQITKHVSLAQRD